MEFPLWSAARAVSGTCRLVAFMAAELGFLHSIAGPLTKALRRSQAVALAANQVGHQPNSRRDAVAHQAGLRRSRTPACSSIIAMGNSSPFAAP